jgi:hypothetical protein
MRNTLTILVPLLLILTSSCSVKKYVNDKFPKLTTIDQQYNAIEQNQMYIDSLKPSIGIFVSEDVLLKILPNALKETIENSDSDELIVTSFDTNVSLKKQAIGIEGDFTITLPEYYAVIKGNMNGTSAVSSLSDSIYIRTAFQSLRIKDITFTQNPGIGKRAVAKLIVPLLKNFIERVNGQYLKEPSVVDASWKESLAFDPKSLSSKGELIVSGDVVNIERNLKQSSVIIGDDGLSIMIELSDLPQQSFPDDQVVTNNHSQSELNQKFKAYQDQYDQVWQDNFTSVSDSTFMSVTIRKKELASIFNETLSKGIQLRQKIDIEKESFSEDVELEKSNIDCEKVRTKFKFEKFRGESCNWNCTKVLGVPVDPICESNKLACKTIRETARIAWQVARETARIAHQAKNELAVAGCKASLELNNFIDIGKFKGSASGSGFGDISLNQFKFDEDLSSISFNLSGNVNLDIKTELELRPQNLGYIFLCHTDYRKVSTSRARARFPKQDLVVNISANQVDDNLELVMNLPEIDYQATITPGPIENYLKDPLLAAKCPIFYALLYSGTAVGTAADFVDLIKLSDQQKLILYGTTKSKYQIGSIKQVLRPTSFSIDENQKIDSQIHWGEKSIDFVSKKQ